MLHLAEGLRAGERCRQGGGRAAHAGWALPVPRRNSVRSSNPAWGYPALPTPLCPPGRHVALPRAGTPLNQQQSQQMENQRMKTPDLQLQL